MVHSWFIKKDGKEKLQYHTTGRDKQKFMGERLRYSLSKRFPFHRVKGKRLVLDR